MLNVKRVVVGGIALVIFMYFANNYAMRYYNIKDGVVPFVIFFFLIAAYITLRSTKRRKHDKGRIYRDKERHYFPEYVKAQTMSKQHNKCPECNEAFKL